MFRFYRMLYMVVMFQPWLIFIIDFPSLIFFFLQCLKLYVCSFWSPCLSWLGRELTRLTKNCKRRLQTNWCMRLVCLVVGEIVELPGVCKKILKSIRMISKLIIIMFLTKSCRRTCLSIDLNSKVNSVWWLSSILPSSIISHCLTLPLLPLIYAVVRCSSVPLFKFYDQKALVISVLLLHIMLQLSYCCV